MYFFLSTMRQNHLALSFWHSFTQHLADLLYTIAKWNSSRNYSGVPKIQAYLQLLAELLIFLAQMVVHQSTTLLPFANQFFTARNEVAARQCFYICLSFCPQGEVCHTPNRADPPPCAVRAGIRSTSGWFFLVSVTVCHDIYSIRFDK